MATASARIASRPDSRPPSVQPQDQEMPSGSAARHGSGARFSSRDRPRPDRGFRSRGVSESGTHVRTTPSGPQETKDWLEALDASLNRFDTLERYVRGHATMIANLEAKMVETNNRVNAHADLLKKASDASGRTDSHLAEACRNIIARFENQESARAHAARVDAMGCQIEAVMSAIASYVPVPPDGNTPRAQVPADTAERPEQYNVATPQPTGPDAS